MRTMNIAIAPLILAAIAVPAAAATSFAAAIGPVLVASADQPPSQQPDTRGSEPQAQVDLPTSAHDATAPAMPTDPSYQGQPYVGALAPPPAEAMNKSYPTCSAGVSDECRNPHGQ